MPDEEMLDCKCEPKLCELIEGNVVDLELRKHDCEVRTDIKVNRKHCVRVWGQVLDCEGHPVSDASVKLLRCYYCHGELQYKGIAHTITDCLGFYQFDICADNKKNKYKIIVGKATVGNERVVYDDGICDPCEEDDCD